MSKDGYETVDKAWFYVYMVAVTNFRTKSLVHFRKPKECYREIGVEKVVLNSTTGTWYINSISMQVYELI